MAPRPGGETDKLGNKYELAWAIRHALYCILDGRRALTTEDVDPDAGKGSEFTYETGAAVTEVHQLKRQNGNSNSWTIKALADLRIFEAAAAHVAGGRRYHFVSLVPCRPLQKLSERARKSPDLMTFTQAWLTAELRPSSINSRLKESWVALKLRGRRCAACGSPSKTRATSSA